MIVDGLLNEFLSLVYLNLNLFDFVTLYIRTHAEIYTVFVRDDSSRIRYSSVTCVEFLFFPIDQSGNNVNQS
jgi:hypothetical protein